MKLPFSDHFNGKSFFNPHANARGLREVINWLLNRKVDKWPQRLIQPKSIEQKQVAQDALKVTFINHSTVLIQWDELNILTDPIWSERASPFSFLGPKRVHCPGVRLEDLPPINLVLISHNHYDHLDIKTLKQLEKIHHPHFITSYGNRSFLQSLGLKKVDELDWWQSIRLSSRHVIHGVPAQHFSGRSLFDRDKTLWAGFVLKNPTQTIYFAGDTGYGSHFLEIKQKFGQPDLALLPIGAFKPEWFMHPMHMSPKDAVQSHVDLEAHQSIAIHFGTFQLGDEKIDEAQQELKQELNRRQLPDSVFLALEPGEGQEVLIRRKK